jgi:ADP-dependent NAD(P)H-hydrate dehydratase
MAHGKRATFHEITRALLARMPLPEAGQPGKDSRGIVLVVGGSPEMPGAVILAANAALRAGAGKLQIAVARSTSAVVAQAVPEALVARLPETKRGGLGASRRMEELASEADAVLVGPGMAEAAGTARVLRRLVAVVSPRAILVVDAAALLPLAGDPDALKPLAGRAILTPHAGEVASMTGERKETIEKDPAAWARRCAREYGGCVALKGAETFVADRSGHVWRNRAGNRGLAISGSGDTLSGIVAGLAARGAAPPQAAVWAVALHARAGDRLARRMGPLGFLPRELLAEIPGLMRELSRTSS